MRMSRLPIFGTSHIMSFLRELRMDNRRPRKGRFGGVLLLGTFICLLIKQNIYYISCITLF